MKKHVPSDRLNAWRTDTVPHRNANEFIFEQK